MIFNNFLKKLAGTNTLYYPGCVTHFALQDISQQYENLLRQIGLDFIMLPGETLCCGSPVKRAGYAADFEDLKRKNLEIFSRFSIQKIITNCPGCYHTLKHDYGLDTYHITQILADSQSKMEKPAHDLSITYHDPCHLGRWSDIYDEPRQLLAEAGWKVTELPDNHEFSLCCGAGGGMKSNFPELANAIAQERLAQVDNGRLCTTCPLCYAHFKENAQEIEILEFSQAYFSSMEDIS
jgi:Fe-S oxidoreductase